MAVLSFLQGVIDNLSVNVFVAIRVYEAGRVISTARMVTLAVHH